MSKNNNLHSAKKAKNDEFYTRIEDVEKELKYYKDFFKGKKVLCNCNDGKINGERSAFAQYFSMNFEHLGLEKLTCISYNEDGHGMKYVYCGDKNGNHIADDIEWEVSELNGHGDFSDEEGCQMMKECDVVVTNPPFSLFHDFVAQLVKYDKKFLVIGNMNAIGWNDIFPYIKNKKIWLGMSAPRAYSTPLNGVENEKTQYKENGVIYQKFGNHVWFTNIEHSKCNQPLDLYKKYNPKDYPHYDNFGAIEVKKVSEIPCDWDGLMGLPITMMNNFNHNQFEIVGLLCDNKADNINTFNGTPTFTDEKHKKSKCAVLNGKRLFNRILIRRK